MSTAASADGNPMSSHDRQRRASANAPAARARRPIQARLEVGPVDDPLEVEAEATADRVIAAIQTSGGAQAVATARSPIGSIRRVEEEEPLQGSRIARAGAEEEEPLQGSRIARAGAEEKEPLQGSRIARGSDQEGQAPTSSSDDEEEPLQGSRVARASAIGAEGGTVDPELEARLTAGAGSPLPEPVRATMESAFGADFSAVRVSENPAAADIGARAYTTGSDIRFAPGQFKPESTEGQHLLAHELTHVVQQGAATARAAVQRDPIDDAKSNLENFKKQKPAFAPLVAGLGHVVGDPAKVIDFLLTNFQNRNDFSYVGGTMGTWQAMGDCSTLADQFVQILQLAGVPANTKTVNNQPMYVAPTPIIDKGGQTGNVKGGDGGWFFVNHTWVVAAGQEIDVLYGQKGRVASEGGFVLDDTTGERVFSNGKRTIKSTQDGPVMVG